MKAKFKVGDKVKLNPNVRWNNVFMNNVDLLFALGNPRIVEIQPGGLRGKDEHLYPIIYIVNVGNAGNRLWVPEEFIKNKVVI